MENQNENLRNEEIVDDTTVDYVNAIKDLKQNTVDKAKYDALRLENKKLLDTLVNGQVVELPEVKEDEVDLKELRKKVFDNPDQSNLEYITNVLNLRNELLAKGYEDPFVPQGSQINATQADYDKANKVATVLQEMVDEADGDPNVFLNEYQRRVKDTNIRK